MSNIDQEYHRERARAELDAASRTSHARAAAAHLRLSALHMRKLGERGRPDLMVINSEPSHNVAAG